MNCRVKWFLEQAEFIDADVFIFDKDNNVVFKCIDGFSVNDPKCPIPDDEIMRQSIDFWTLDATTGTPILKIFL